MNTHTHIPTNTNTNEQPSSVTAEPSDQTPAQKPKRKLRRNGVIARLPKRERDLVNQMLLDGSPYRGIVYALDECGYDVTERNISNWARGGHQDWLRELDRIHEHRCRQDRLIGLLRHNDATNLPEVGLQMAATALSELLAQCSIPLDNQKPDLTKYLQIIRTLCRLSRELFKLQEYRDENARRLGDEYSPEEIEKDNDEFFENLRQQFSELGLKQQDRELAELEAKEKEIEEGRAKPQRDEPEESISVIVMRKFLEDLRAQRKRDQPPTPPADTPPPDPPTSAP